MANHPISNLPLLTAGVAGNEERTNRSLYMVTSLLGGVTGRQTTPPGSPADGASYIILATATGAWAGKEDQVAVYVTGAWYYVTPWEGLTVRVNDANISYTYSGSAWAAVGTRTIGLAFTGLMAADSTSMTMVAVSAPDTYGASGTDVYGFPAPVTGRIKSVSVAALHLDATSPPATWTLVIEPKGGGTDWLDGTFDLHATAGAQQSTVIANLLAPGVNFNAGDRFQITANGAAVNILLIQGTILFEEFV